MPRVRKIELPRASALWSRIAKGDFVDCYAVPADFPARQAAEIVAAFPPWVAFLVRIRGILTAPFGLRNEGPKAADMIGFFPVESETKEEVIAGFNDRHLDFRVSIQQRDGHVSLATWVHPHNFGGKFYLTAILPFHVLVARDALKRVAATA